MLLPLFFEKNICREADAENVVKGVNEDPYLLCRNNSSNMQYCMEKILSSKVSQP